jgi:hypothetical protein
MDKENLLEQELADMLEVQGFDHAQETEEPKEEAPVLEEPPAETPAEVKSEEPPAEAADDEKKEEETPEQLMQHYLSEIDRLNGQVLQLSKGASKEAEPATETPPKEDEIDFLSDLDMDDVVGDRATLNKVLRSVYQRGLKDAQTKLREWTLQQIPQATLSYVNNYMTMKEKVDEFYSSNKDLLPFRKVMAAVSNDVSAAEPGLTISEVLKKSGDRVRASLKIKPVTPSDNQKKKKDPGFPRSSGARSAAGTTTLDPLAAEIAEMNDALNS